MRRRLAEADAGIEPDLLARHAGGDRGLGPRGEEGRHLGDDVVVARRCCIVRGSPCMCISTTSQPSSAAVGQALAATRQSAVTSFHIVAPAATAARATARLHGVDGDRDVALAPDRRRSPERRGRSPRPRRPARRRGRVDSPPMSRMSAPSAISRRAWASAASASRNRPPSEKLSGVTLTIPMTRPPPRGQGWGWGRRQACLAAPTRPLRGHPPLEGEGAASSRLWRGAGRDRGGGGTRREGDRRARAGRRRHLRLVAARRDALQHVDDLVAAQGLVLEQRLGQRCADPRCFSVRMRLASS